MNKPSGSRWITLSATIIKDVVSITMKHKKNSLLMPVLLCAVQEMQQAVNHEQPEEEEENGEHNPFYI